MLTEGLLVRRVTVGQRTCAELLGPGDVVQPWLRVGPDDSIGSDVSWQVAQPVRMALLDRDFLVRVIRWPEIPAAIARRVMLRVHWLAFHLAVCHLRRVDDRVLLVLWHFADRWGRVTPRGVELDLPLTHRLLAAVVGAYRPSVTVAVGALTEAGLIEHTSRSRWTLFGQPPEELRQVHEHAVDRERPMPSEVRRRSRATRSDDPAAPATKSRNGKAPASRRPGDDPVAPGAEHEPPTAANGERPRGGGEQLADPAAVSPQAQPASGALAQGEDLDPEVPNGTPEPSRK